MLVEGIGERAPARVTIALSLADLTWLRQRAEMRDGHRRYGARRDQWGRGLSPEPIWRGLVGEHALWVYLTRAGLACAPVDTALHTGDQGTDLRCAGWRLQVKTRRRNYGALLVHRISEARRLRPLACEAYVCAEWVGDTRPVQLIGWIRSEEFTARAQLRRARVGKHWNSEVADRLLAPMGRLVEALTVRTLVP